MTYCKLGEHVRVSYKFANEDEKAYETDKSPVEVSIKNVPTFQTKNFKAGGFTVNFNSPNNFYGGVTLIVRDFYYQPEQIQYDYGLPHTASFGYPGIDQHGIVFRPCENQPANYPDLPYGFVLGPVADLNTLKIDLTRGCNKLVEVEKDKCLLEVRSTLSKEILFSVAGDCPCEYKVACGNNCPNGYLKCESSSYPGYCCISCNQIKSKVNILIAKASFNQK